MRYLRHTFTECSFNPDERMKKVTDIYADGHIVRRVYRGRKMISKYEISVSSDDVASLLIEVMNGGEGVCYLDAFATAKIFNDDGSSSELEVPRCLENFVCGLDFGDEEFFGK